MTPGPAGPNAWLARYLAIPFVDRGRGWDGVDCRGLVLLILEHERGIVVPEPETLYASTGIGDAAAMHAVARAAAARWRPCPVERFAVLHFERPRLPPHVGLSLGGGDFIHAEAGLGVVVSALDRPEPGAAWRWRDYLKGAFVYDG